MVFVAANELSGALINCVTSFIVVFAVLAFLCFVISLLKNLDGRGSQPAKKTETPAAAKAAVPLQVQQVGPGSMASTKVDFAGEVEPSVAAAILAAAAQTCGGKVKVVSIKKSK